MEFTRQNLKTPADPVDVDPALVVSISAVKKNVTKIVTQKTERNEYLVDGDANAVAIALGWKKETDNAATDDQE